MKESEEAEFEEYRRVLGKIEDAIHGESINHIMNALCYVLGAVGADVVDSKRVLLANVFESVEKSYEIHKSEYDNGEIKWLN